MVGTIKLDGFSAMWAAVLLYKLFTIRWFSRLFQRAGSVVFPSSRVCIKSTPFPSHAEASTMRFAAEHTIIPVPKVYTAFAHKGRVYIVKERIDGLPLTSGWRQLTAESQAAILNSLRGMIQQLRHIPAPPECGVSNVDGGPIFDPRLPGPHHWGPFRTVDDFHRKLRADVEEPEFAGTPIPDLSHQIFFHKQPSSSPVFLHGDLSSPNILARGDEVVGIVDWETAGWMPPYWEYTSAWNVSPQNQFWQDKVDRFSEPLPEALEMETIRRKYNGDY